MIAPIDETTDALWAAIQRSSPSVTREEIATILRVAMEAPTASDDLGLARIHETDDVREWRYAQSGMRITYRPYVPPVLDIGRIPAGTVVTGEMVDDLGKKVTVFSATVPDAQVIAPRSTTTELG